MAAAGLSGSVKWQQLCRLLDKVKAGKRNTKKELLHNFMQSCRDVLQQRRQLCPEATDSFYPVMRVLLPALDKERGAYGVKEKKLADLYIKVLGIKKDAPDALKLLNYRKPKMAGANVGGADFADVAYYVLKSRCPAEGSLTLGDVDGHLDSIAADHAAKKHDAVTSTLLLLLRSLTATEQKWLIRVLLKDMQLGLGTAAVLGAWHPDARDFYDVNNSLSKVCHVLRDPEVRLHEVEVSLFAPFRPMLAERAVLEKVEAQMKNKTYVAENKFDGERSQIHKKGDKYMYFSRNGFDFTTNFGGSPQTGLLTPHLHLLLQPHVDEAILDGEVVCWHKEHNVVVNKGEHFDVKNLHPDGPLQVCFCAFDLLLLNGRVLTNLPLRQRCDLLASTINESPGRVVVSRQEDVQDKAAVVRALNVAIDRREEGLVLKDPDSVYRPAARTAGWIKVKPDYVDELVPALDLLIVGGYYGSGQQHGVLSHFLLAAADTDSITDGGRVTRVVSVCRVGSGYTDDELSVLSAKLAPYSVRSRPNEVVECGKDKPHVWFTPSKSVVLQVRAAEVSTSKTYGAGLTLRFPRVDVIRTDKSWQDVLTTAQLDALFKEASGKLAVNHYTEGDNASESSSGAATKAGRQGATRSAALPQHFTPANLQGVEQTCAALAGKELCVLEGGDLHTKQELERMVVQAGGRVTQNPTSETYCVLCSQHNIRSMNLSHKHNIVKPAWLMRCIKSGALLPWGPLDDLSLLPEEQAKMKLTYDKYGDSYTRDVDVEDLQIVLDNMPDVTAKEDEVSELREILMDYDEPHNIFSRVTALFVDEAGTPVSPSTAPLVRLLLRLYGGVAVDSMSSAVTHLMCCSPSCSVLWSSREGRYLVTKDWLFDGVQRKRRLDERRYEPAMMLL